VATRAARASVSKVSSAARMRAAAARSASKAVIGASKASSGGEQGAQSTRVQPVLAMDQCATSCSSVIPDFFVSTIEGDAMFTGQLLSLAGLGGPENAHDVAAAARSGGLRALQGKFEKKKKKKKKTVVSPRPS
jgi:hypothetical protein